jgi:hypothetical protein
LLESAIAAPQATILGEPVFADAIEVGAAYLFYFCQNHPFIDGNKRIALATCLIFLSENDLLSNESLDCAAFEKLTLNVVLKWFGLNLGGSPSGLIGQKRHQLQGSARTETGPPEHYSIDKDKPSQNWYKASGNDRTSPRPRP